MTRKTVPELEAELDTLRSLIGITEDGRGRTFLHKESGICYIAMDAGYRELDMVPGIWYTPLGNPRVKFFRPFEEFQRKFEPVLKNSAYKAVR